MRNSEISMLSVGATGAGAGVAGSSARVHPAAATAKAASRSALLAAGIRRNSGGATDRLVADEQGELRREGEPLRLRVALLVELPATEHTAGGVHLGIRPLRAGH